MIRHIVFLAVAAALFAALMATTPAGTALPRWAQAAGALAVSAFVAWALTGVLAPGRDGHGRDDT